MGDSDDFRGDHALVMAASDMDACESAAHPVPVGHRAIKATVAIICGCVAVSGIGYALQAQGQPRTDEVRNGMGGFVGLAENLLCKKDDTSCECFSSRDVKFCSTCPGTECGDCEDY